eukprot:scaffold5887_cov122-Cylindrotheca_fusiformis.AAC.12
MRRCQETRRSFKVSEKIMTVPRHSSRSLMGGKRTSCSVGHLVAATLFLCCSYILWLSGIDPSDLVQQGERQRDSSNSMYGNAGATANIRSLSVAARNDHQNSAAGHHEVVMTKATTAVKSDVSPEGSLNVEGRTPYYLTGRTAEKFSSHDEYDEERIFQSIHDAPIQNIPDSQNNWIMHRRLPKTTRNHDNVMFDVESSGRHVLVVMLGRHSETLQWIDVMTGKQNYTMVKGNDPAGNPLNNLNHVCSVVVDSLSTPSYKEIWLPCGFHGHGVNEEWSSEYARIVNLKTMKVETGPKLPYAGGACVALPIHIKGPDEPAHICVFGGTEGQHDKGTFLPYTSCYDRKEQHWHHPFGRLPFGFDHGNALHLPAGVCDPADPERILISNFRTEPYGTPHSEILAFDIPPSSPYWTDEQLTSLSPETPGKWYVYANISYSGIDDEVNAPRDASGIVVANNWRNLINFGGVHYHGHHQVTRTNGQTVMTQSRRRYSTVRSLDICSKTWSKVGELGVETFALQTSVSGKLNVAITCGGQSFTTRKENSPWCLVNRIPGVQFQTNRGCTVNDDEIAGVVFAD